MDKIFINKTFLSHMLFNLLVTAVIICASVFLPMQTVCLAQDDEQPGDLSSELKKLSLKELMDIEIISVSKKLEKLSEAAAAIFVITQEDIRRSGAIAIPELLRMVPGIQVARTASNYWKVSSRGFLGEYSNKLDQYLPWNINL